MRFATTSCAKNGRPVPEGFLEVVAALTGLAYTIAPQLDEIAYGDQFHVTALGLLGMIVWGYRMWWQRRPT